MQQTAISSIIASTMTYPVEITKAQYQVSKVNYGKDMPAKKVISNIYRRQGLFGFYRGNMANMATYPFFWTVYFSIYDNIRFNLTDNKYFNKFLVSWSAGAIGSTVASPFYVMKTRVQTNILNSDKPKSYFRIVRDLWIKEGYVAFFKGLGPTLINNGKLGVQMPFCDLLIEKTGNAFLGAGIGKILCSGVFYPMDLIRTNQRDATTKLSIKDVVLRIYRTGGIISFYRGVGLYTCVTGPNFVIMMGLKHMFNK